MNKNKLTKAKRRERRQFRVRACISGTKERPRLNIHRSLRNLFVQLIDDSDSKTILGFSTKTAKLTGDAGERKGKVAQAYLLGKELAKKAIDLGVEQVVFDRAGYKYHGKVKALADGARDGGLKF